MRQGWQMIFRHGPAQRRILRVNSKQRLHSYSFNSSLLEIKFSGSMGEYFFIATKNINYFFNYSIF
jgi:hypothetical protein